MFKMLHRTRMSVFKDDDSVLQGELLTLLGLISSRRIFVSICLTNQPTLHNRILSSCFLFPLHKAARLKINEEFRKNQNETSEENINKVQ